LTGERDRARANQQAVAGSLLRRQSFQFRRIGRARILKNNPHDGPARLMEKSPFLAALQVLMDSSMN